MPWQDPPWRFTFHNQEEWKGELLSRPCSPCFGVALHRKLVLCKPHTQFGHVPVTGHGCWLWHGTTPRTTVVQTGEFQSGQHNFLVPQVSCLPSNCQVCLLQDTDIKLQACVLQEAVNCKLASSCLCYRYHLVLILSCCLVLFNTEHVQYFLWRGNTVLEERCYIRTHLHCVPKFQSCSTA